MEETTVVKPTGSTSPAGSPRRLAAWGLSLAAVAFVIGLGMARALVGLGAALGCLVAAVYAWRYITSHLSMARRERIVEPRLIRSTTVRILLLAVVSATVFLLGRDVFIAYLAAFALALAVLLFAEAPRVMRQLRSG